MERHFVRSLWLAVGAAALVGCSGSDDVGDDDGAKSNPPIAWAKALNHPFTGTDGNIDLNVRAGSEVFVNGIESFGPTVPVVRYNWTVSRHPASGTIELVKRNSSTVSFRAPQVSHRTDLELRLVVTDSNGVTDDATVRVTVEPIPDPNAFLTYGGAQTFTIAAVANAVPTLGADVPFDLVVERRIRYFDLNGTERTNMLLETTTLSGAWLAAYGTGGTSGGTDGCGGFQNPRFTLPLPTVNTDDVLAKVGFDRPSEAVDLARIDEARVTLQVRLTSRAEALPAGANVCVPGVQPILANDGVSVIIELDGAGTNDLMGPAIVARADTRESAEAYYRTIDTNEDYETKRRFSGWLQKAEFTTGSTDWEAIRQGSSAHAVYLNNFDLGFGRDMYMRIGQCDGSQSAPALGGSIDPARLGQCDVYGVVVNYANLEAATNRVGPILAVAMEYARTPSSTNRVTKFYTYAPDRQGDFTRVLSANLDGRGEKFVPGVCTVCHGGTPLGLDSTDSSKYAKGGDVNSGFISWDLDAFLYSDDDPYFSKPTDPDFSGEDAAEVARYTRSAQAAEFKKLNQLAYLTFANPDPTSTDPAISARFDLARDLVEGWYGSEGMPESTFNGAYVPDGWLNSVDGNPADAETIYKQVFAQNCRACHVLQIPDGKVGQRAMGSYRDFIDTANLAQSLGAGEMPFARMTMDRLWTNDAGATLQEHLINNGRGFAAPGTPGLCVSQSVLTPDRGKPVQLDASCSTFVAQFEWRVTDPSGQAVPVVGARSATAAFVASTEGEYLATVTDSATGDALQVIARIEKSVPIAGSTSTPIARQLPVNGSLVFDVDIVDELVGTVSRDPIQAIRIGSLQGVESAIPSPVDPTGSIRINISSLSTDLATVRYTIEDADGDVSANSGLIEIDVDAQISLQEATPLRVDANGSTTLNLASLLNDPPAGEPIAFEVIQQPTLERSRGPGQATLNGSVVTYRAPLGVANEVASTGLLLPPYSLLPPGQRDLFNFRAYFVNRPEEGTNGTVQANLLATTRFDQIATDLRARCSTCHANVQVGSVLVIRSNSSDTDIYCSLTVGTAVRGPEAAEATGTPYMNLANPSESVVNLKSRGGLNHGGNGGAVTGFDSARLQLWIDEGAYFTNASTPPTCSSTETPPSTGTPAAGSATRLATWVSSSNRSIDVDVSALVGTANAAVISTDPGTDIATQGEVTAARTSPLNLRITLQSLAGAPGVVGQVSYRVKNVLGEVSGTGIITVEASAATPTLTRQTFSQESPVAVNSSNVQVLSELGTSKLASAAAGASLECRLTANTPSLPQNPLAVENGTPSTASATVTCAAIRYTPPAATQTRFGPVQFRPADSVRYRVCYQGSNICSEEASVSIDVEGTQHFSDLHGAMNSADTGCTVACHDTGAVAPQRWTYAADVGVTYCSIRSGVTTSNAPLLAVGTANTSALYTVPFTGQLVGGNPGSHSQRITLANSLLEWIGEGAYNTTNSNQSCP